MAKLILFRHGQSVWNKLNLFTGWVNIPISDVGIEECLQAGKKIANQNIDVIYTSSLVRAQESALIAMSGHASGKSPCIAVSEQDPKRSWYENAGSSHDLIPAYAAWELNERMYGELQGKNKQTVIEEHGAELVQIWRRSFRTRPPGGESLADTADRTIPFFIKQIEPHLARGEDVFVVAHGNSLRAIVMYIENISEEDILHREIATGELLLYEYSEGDFLRQ